MFNLQASPVTESQWKKIAKALYYSAASGFSGGFILALAGVLSSGDASLGSALLTAAAVGGVVGALNSLAVTVKQVFSVDN